MGVIEDRYSRYQRRLQLAIRMLRYEARTQTICRWTGLKPRRVRRLCGSLREVEPVPLNRRRGPSPQRLSAFLTTASLRSEAAAMAGLCRAVGVVPSERLPNANRTLPGVVRGERLLCALDLFTQIVPQRRLTLEQWTVIAITLAEGVEWTIDHCTACHAIILIERIWVGRTLCAHCRKDAESGAAPLLENDPEVSSQEELPVQKDLFE
jgi:hypothetical protein